jgi:hypothetical protein
MRVTHHWDVPGEAGENDARDSHDNEDDPGEILAGVFGCK